MSNPFLEKNLYATTIERTPLPYAGLPKYNFSGGHNDPATIPAGLLAEVANEVVHRFGDRLALYHLGEGPAGSSLLRQVTAELLGRNRNIKCDPDDILITTGSGQALDIICRAFVAAGDIVLTDEFTFVSMLNKIKNSGGIPKGVKCDEGGLIPKALVSSLEELRVAGRRPKFLYIQPSLQNPTTTVMPQDRRQEIVRIAREHDLFICEDECYANLLPNGSGGPTLYQLAPERVIYVGSYSKSLAPALRIGYLLGDRVALEHIVSVRRDMGTGALDQLVAAAYFSKHFDEHLENLRNSLAAKRDLMARAFVRVFGDHVSFTVPPGGLFMWVEFRGGLPTKHLLASAQKVGIAFNPGGEWAADPACGEFHARFCYALPTQDEITEGIELLGRVYFNELSQGVRAIS